MQHKQGSYHTANRRVIKTHCIHTHCELHTISACKHFWNSWGYHCCTQCFPLWNLYTSCWAWSFFFFFLYIMFVAFVQSPGSHSTHASAYPHVNKREVFMHAPVQKCMDAHTCTQTHTYTLTHVHVCTHPTTYTNTYSTHTHTHTHTLTLWLYGLLEKSSGLM